MRDYSSSSPPNLFSSSPYSSTHSTHQSNGAPSTAAAAAAGTRQLRSPSASSTSSHHTNPDSSSTASSSSRRRGNEQMGDQGYYSSSSITDEPTGKDSPNKRARTGSLSEHEPDVGSPAAFHPTPPANPHASPDDQTAQSATIPMSMPKMTRPLSPSEQGNLLRSAMLQRLHLDQTVYLIPTKWFNTFTRWTAGAGAAPGPIDPQATLLDSEGVLFDGLVEDRDWVFVHQQGWEMIKECHGAQSSLPRKTIPESPISQTPQIELRPPKIHLTKITRPTIQSQQTFSFYTPYPQPSPTLSLSKSAPVSDLDNKVRDMYDLPGVEIRYFRFDLVGGRDVTRDTSPAKVRRLIDVDAPLDTSLLTRTLGEIGLVEPRLGIAFEHRHPNQKFPLDTSPTTSPTQQSPPSQGHTLGAAPNVLGFETRGRPLSKGYTSDSLGTTRKKSLNLGDSTDDEESGAGRLIGPLLPGSYPRTPDASPARAGTTTGAAAVRSASADRVERRAGAFNLRFSSGSGFLKDERVRGTTGLNNLGNTCYMNSALQCLVHCKELTEYFLSKVYEKELNTTNPLGMKGQLAATYAALINILFPFTNIKPTFPPADFKRVIGRFAPNFSGYGQQDSQEFLAFLLDGLHEDLNRVRAKPYVVRDELIGVFPSEEQLRELAERSWRGHKMRNDSVVVDLWQGMYKSTVVCPDCDVVSVTFDPFMDLSVPLPIKQTWKHPGIIFVPDEGPLVMIPVELPKSATIKDLKHVIAERMNVDPTILHCAEKWNRKFYKHHTDSMNLADTITTPANDEVVIYELPGLNDPESILIPVFHASWKLHHTWASSPDDFGMPFLIVLRPAEARDYEVVYDKIRRKYTQFSTAPELREPPPTDQFEAAAHEEQQVDGDPADDLVMEDVVLTRAELADRQQVKKSVTIRVQGYIRSFSFYHVSDDDNKLPTSVERTLSLLPDLQEYLRPPEPAEVEEEAPQRMQSLAPSAMESVHLENSPIPVVEEEDDTVAPTPTCHTQFPGFSITDDEPRQPPQEDVVDDFINISVFDDNAQLSDGEMLPSLQPTPSPSMMDSDDENVTASQLGIGIRATAPSPNGIVEEPLPTYTSLFSQHQQQEYESKDASVPDVPTLKLGDALLCEWSEVAYQHIFANPDHPTHWNPTQTWIDPNPPPEQQPRKKANIDLDDCLDEFGREEQLGQDDLWYCPRCKEHRQAKKTLQLWRVPDIFAVHLKRFSANRGWRDKLDNLIEFPLQGLDLTERVGDKSMLAEGERLVYDLFAVDNHYGGLGGGHYTAHAQNFVDGKWYCFDDSSVRPVNPEDCITTAAYLLFYRRRSDSPLGRNTSRLIAEYLAQVDEEQNKAVEEEGEEGEDEQSSSTTASPKVDGEDESSSSSSPFPSVMSKGFKTSLLTSSKYTTIDHQMTPTTWGGGWSNRMNRAYLNSTSHKSTDEANEADQPNYTDPETEMLGMEFRGPDDDDVDLISTGPEDRDINPEGEN